MAQTFAVLTLPPAQFSGGLGKGLNFVASFQEGCKREELQDPSLHVLQCPGAGTHPWLSESSSLLTPNGLTKRGQKPSKISPRLEAKL